MLRVLRGGIVREGSVRDLLGQRAGAGGAL